MTLIFDYYIISPAYLNQKKDIILQQKMIKQKKRRKLYKKLKQQQPLPTQTDNKIVTRQQKLCKQLVQQSYTNISDEEDDNFLKCNQRFYKAYTEMSNNKMPELQKINRKDTTLSIKKQKKDKRLLPFVQSIEKKKSNKLQMPVLSLSQFIIIDQRDKNKDRSHSSNKLPSSPLNVLQPKFTKLFFSLHKDAKQKTVIHEQQCIKDKPKQKLNQSLSSAQKFRQIKNLYKPYHSRNYHKKIETDIIKFLL